MVRNNNSQLHALTLVDRCISAGRQSIRILCRPRRVQRKQYSLDEGSVTCRCHCRGAFRQAGPHPRLHSSGSFWQVLREPTESNKANAMQRGCSAVDTGHPAVIAELEEAHRMLSTSRAQLALRILDCAFGGRRDGVHVLCEERACEVAPEPVALVWFLSVAIQFAGHLAKLPSRRAGRVQRQRCTASTGVLNTSASLRAVHASPSSITILPDMVDLLLSTRHRFASPTG